MTFVRGCADADGRFPRRVCGKRQPRAETVRRWAYEEELSPKVGGDSESRAGGQGGRERVTREGSLTKAPVSQPV